MAKADPGKLYGKKTDDGVCYVALGRAVAEGIAAENPVALKEFARLVRSIIDSGREGGADGTSQG